MIGFPTISEKVNTIIFMVFIYQAVMQLYQYWIFFTNKQEDHFDSMSITEIGGPGIRSRANQNYISVIKMKGTP